MSFRPGHLPTLIPFLCFKVSLKKDKIFKGANVTLVSVINESLHEVSYNVVFATTTCAYVQSDQSLC